MSDFELKVGDSIADRYEIVAVLEKTALGQSVHVQGKQDGQAYHLLHLAFELNEQRFQALKLKIQSVQAVQHKSLSEVYDCIVIESGAYLRMSYVDGETFASHLRQRRERGQVLGLKAAYSFLAHLCLGLEALHSRGLYFGALSPSTIYVTRQGRVKVLSVLCPLLAQEYLEPAHRRSYFGSAFVSPEVRKQAAPASAASDVYSLGLLFADLLSEQAYEDFMGSPEHFVSRLNVQASVKEAVLQAVHAEPSMRHPSVESFKEAVKRAIDAPADQDLSSIVMGMGELRQFAGAGNSADMPALGQTPSKPDLFDRKQVANQASQARQADAEIWIYQKDGLDYGPFKREGLLKKFYNDDLDELTTVFNVATKKRELLGRIPEFEAEVKAHIPIRDRNRAEQEAKRKRAERRLKTAGASTVILVIFVVMAIIAIPTIILMNMASPEPLDFGAAFKPFEKRFELPKIEEVSLNVDDKRALAIFDPKASAAEREKALAAWEAEHRKRFAERRRAAGAARAGAAEDDDMAVFSFGVGEDGKELEALMDWEVEEQLMNPRALRRQSDCFVKHAGGRSLKVNIDFVIQPSGVVRNLKTNAPVPELNQCLVSAFASLKFRPFGGTVKRVSYPLEYR